MHYRSLLVCLMALPTTVVATAEEPLSTAGRVSAVTVYQGQALVTRTISLNQASGLKEVVVTDLPAKVQPGSLYAEGDEGVTIRSVRYRVRPVEQDVRTEVRELDQQTQDVQDRLNANNREMQLLGERKTYLAKMEGFVTGTANHELKSGVLNAETLKSLTEFVFTERADIASRELKLGIEQRELREELDVLQRKRNQLTHGSAKTVREAVVFADLGGEGDKSLSLTYIVTDATWSPSYNLRADSDAGRVMVEYNASIQQRSGEDWADVAMTLSTATPSLIATAPELEALAIRLTSPSAQQQPARRDFAKAKSELLRQQRRLSELRNSYADQPATSAPQQAEADALQAELGDLFAQNGINQSALSSSGVRGGRSGGAGGFGGMFTAGHGAADLGLNSLACAVQVLEYNDDANRRATFERADPKEQGISVSYKLDGMSSLPSRSDRQLIQIASLPLEGEFYHVAMPVLTEYVYKEAMLANSTDMVLLAGPSATFLDGEFVGRGDVPTISSGAPLTVGLGIDTSLRAARELVRKTSRTQGGNRVQELNYRLTIDNFSDREVDVRLMDRLPKPQNDEIKVTLLESDQQVSTDAQYQRDVRKKGILRWDLAAGAGKNGLDAVYLDYTLRLEHDKELQITGLQPTGQPQRR